MASNGGSGGGPRGCASSAAAFGMQAVKGRWFMVFATILIMSMSGPTYLFAAYSGVVKSTLGYSQTTLNWISFFKDVGTTVGIPSGLLMEVTPPWVVLATGAGLNFFGYFMIWLSVTERIAKPHVWQMCIYIGLSANFLAFSNTGAMVPCVMNFPEGRGVVLGVLKGFVGLSSAIITQLYRAIFFQNPKALILFIAFLPAAVTIVVIPTIRIMKNVVVTHPGKDVKVFYQILYMSLCLAGFILLMIVIQTGVTFSQGAYGASAVIVVLLLCLPLYTVFRQERTLWKAKLRQELERVEVVAGDVTGPEKRPAREVDRWSENVFRPPERGDDHTILQALFSFDMIILFIVTICGMGGNLTAIDNLGQIGSSLGYPAKSITTFVSLVSIWNYLGRVVSGFVSEYLLTNYRLPRPVMVTFVTLLSCVGHLLIAFGVTKGLYVSSVIIGFCYGAYWPLSMAIISEIFGLKYYSTLFNFGPLASPLGVYILNVRVTGSLYDKEALRQLAARGLTRKEGQELTCDGVSCFKKAELIITAVTAAAVLVSLVLVVRTRKFYKGDIYERFRKVENAVVVEGGGTAVEEMNGVEGREKEIGKE
ncbi:hypothetical protein V2J09_001396 [Rumex salicifolius]